MDIPKNEMFQKLKLKCKHFPRIPCQTIFLAKYFNIIQRQTSTLPMSKIIEFCNDYLVI